MPEDKRPPDFDWVTERHKCSLPAMFVFLKQLAERDIKMHAEQTTTPRPAMVFQPSGVDYFFSVNRGGRREIVSFTLKEDDGHILIEGPRGRVHKVTLTLNDEGHCKLRANESETPLDPWQVMRLVLEPILFPTGPDSEV